MNIFSSFPILPPVPPFPCQLTKESRRQKHISCDIISMFSSHYRASFRKKMQRQNCISGKSWLIPLALTATLSERETERERDSHKHRSHAQREKKVPSFPGQFSFRPQGTETEGENGKKWFIMVISDNYYVQCEHCNVR